MSRRAVFLDRDGTLVHPRHYPSRPEELVLYDGLGPELRHLQAAGFALVVVTNQAGIARGYFTDEDLTLLHTHLRAELAALCVQLDGIYHCPHHIDGVIPELAIACTCRKPRPGMLWRARSDLGIDLEASWFVGDILDDVEAGNNARCRTILVDLGTEFPPTSAIRRPEFVARDTRHALLLIEAEEHLLPRGEMEIDRSYRPPNWQIRNGPARTAPPGAGGRHDDGS